MKYSAVTPVRDESGNLPRLAESLAAQTIRPTRWLIIDTGSTDDTVGLATRLAEQHPWIAFQEGRAAVGADRGWPVVRAVQDGFGVLLAQHPDVVAKLDADVSFGPDFFERVLQQFDDDPALGIAGGVCHELHGDVWRPRPVTAEAHVWGATRAYRRECLADVLPLEPRLGFEAVDELKAALAGWSTRTILDVPFFHHRREGERDGARWRAWAAEGDLAHYMTYRPSWVFLRTVNRMRLDPSAAAVLFGYVRAFARRKPRCGDDGVRRLLREQQRARHLRARLREARRIESGSRDVPLSGLR